MKEKVGKERENEKSVEVSESNKNEKSDKLEATF
mgnify:CR=1 FL=1